MNPLRMKYRLLFLILLPFFVLMGLLIQFLYSDYEDVQEMNQVIRLSTLGNQISLLIDSLQEELTFTHLNLLEKDSTYNQHLQETQQQTDARFSTIKKLVNQHSFEETHSFLPLTFQETFEKLDALNQKRQQLFSGILSLQDFTQSIQNLTEELIVHISNIATASTDAELAKALFAYINLIYEKWMANQEKRLVFVSLLKERLTVDQYIRLIDAIGQQVAFKKAFFGVATPMQEEIYQTVMSTPLIQDASHMEEMAIAQGPNTPLHLNATRWWEAQTEKVNKLREVETRLQKERIHDIQLRKANKERNIILVLTIALLTLGITLYFLFKNLGLLAQRLQEEVNLLTSSGQEIFSDVKDTSAITQEAASSVAYTTDIVERLKQTAQASAGKADHVSQVSDQSLKVLQDSEKAINETIQGMNRIQEGMQTVSNSITKLSDHSQIIGNIIGSVNDISEQSHLLAVNAAIEAAKAGEQGKGFTVVAQEMRNLAQQSKQATGQVRNILHDIQRDIHAAVTAAEQGSLLVANGMNQSSQTNQSIRSLFEKITNVAQAANQIAHSSQQQLIGVEEVTVAMNQIKKASHQQVAKMQHIELGIRQLNEVGNNLKDLSHEYRL